MGKRVHRETDSRVCGASTDVTGQSTVFANDLLVSVDEDPNTHGNGDLNAGANKVFAEDRLVVRIYDDADPDDLCPPLGGAHCDPDSSSASPDVFAGFPSIVNLGVDPRIPDGEPTRGLDQGVFQGQDPTDPNEFPYPTQPSPGSPLNEPDAPKMQKASPGGSNISTTEEGGPFVGEEQAPGSPPTALIGDCNRPDLGNVSERYESNGNPGAIGFDSTGGYSYGSYQIATKTGTFSGYMNFLQQYNPTYYNELQSAGGTSAATSGAPPFQNKWRELATEPDFAQSQHDFIQVSHYDPQVEKIKNSTGLDPCDGTHCPGLQDAIWSTAVQHGPNTGIVEGAIADAGPGASDQDIINAIYDERSKVSIYFSSSTPRVQQSVLNRFTRERADALAACP